MRKWYLLASIVSAIAVRVIVSETASAVPGYAALVAAALERDGELTALALARERTQVALERARINKDTPSFAAGTGSATAYAGDLGVGFYASPSATATLPGGASLGISVPVGLGAYGDFFSPGIEVGLPIVRGKDEALVAVERGTAALFAARAAETARRIGLERELVAVLRTAAGAEIELQSAHGEEAKARRELERAARLDGAEPGGVAYRRLERSARAKARSLRDAESALAAALGDIASITGGSYDFDRRFLPKDLPSPDFRAALPDPSAAAAVSLARSAERARAFEASQEARRFRLGTKLGASYSSGSGEDYSGDSVYAGLGLAASVAAALDDLDISLGAGYSGGTPSLGLALTWKPAPRRDRELRDRDERLAASAGAADIAKAIEAARRELVKLESERARITAAGEDATWELEEARAQAAEYERWRAKGLVGDEEYEEVLAEARECEARAQAAALDRLLWALDVRAIAGDPSWGEEP